MIDIKETSGLRKEFNMWGWRWETCLESERPLNLNSPICYFYKDEVICIEDTLLLFQTYNPKEVSWWNKDYSSKMIYNPEYSCGLVKSIDTVKVNSVIEADLMFPIGKNLWPSFWLTACDSWPPEIDIVEAYSNNKNSYKGKIKFSYKWPFIYRELRFESNIHYKEDNGKHLSIGAKGVNPKVMESPVEEKWNRFTCIWTDSIIEIFANGILVRKVTDPFILSKMKTEGMWVVFNIWPRDNKKSFHNPYSPFKIKNFKVTKI